MDHYDLLARPDWKAKSVLIVSPYVERRFFVRLLKQLKPKKLIVVIDDGCRADDITMIEGLSHNQTAVRAALGSARGLVHAKIFHVEWITTGGSRAHSLIYGSGNATWQAFEGSNSELMCKARLTSANHSPILDWLKRVQVAGSNPKGNDLVIPALLDAWLADGVHIRLPHLTIRHVGNKASNLDLWLQRGRLLSTFVPDPSFLRVTVRLREELPPSEAEQIVQNMGFETLRTQRLSFPYIASSGPLPEENDAPGNWRSRFFAWTQLGFWCSDSCFRAKRELFRKAGHEERSNNLLKLQELNDRSLRDTISLRFIGSVVQLWEAFESQAATFLESRGGELNKSFYVKLFEQQVERDLELANDAEFRERYINGCEIFDTPRFRMDAAAWRSFVESFARQMHVEFLKRRSQSLIFHQIYATISDVDEGAFDEPKKLVKFLRSNWNAIIEGDDGDKISAGLYIDDYHRN